MFHEYIKLVGFVAVDTRNDFAMLQDLLCLFFIVPQGLLTHRPRAKQASGSC